MVGIIILAAVIIFCKRKKTEYWGNGVLLSGNSVVGPEAGRHTMAFTLNFENGEVSGGGTDNIGSFSWKGQYDTQAMTCVMLKSYLTHVVLYEGKVDEKQKLQ